MFCYFRSDENDGNLGQIQIARKPGRIRRSCSLDPIELCDWAQRKTGLEDFGDSSFLAALAILTESMEDEADLHPFGRFLARMHIRTLLEMRLLLVAAWKKTNKADKRPISRPIFITGMPRSGSTFLHELLSRDPANRAPRFWEVMFPLPAPEAADRAQPGVFGKRRFNLWWFRRLAPQPDSVYPMRANTPHECVAMHSYTFFSQEFVSIFHVPTFEAWLNTAGCSLHTPGRDVFSSIFSSSGRKQWMLKSPDHVRSLDALFRRFPTRSCKCTAIPSKC